MPAQFGILLADHFFQLPSYQITRSDCMSIPHGTDSLRDQRQEVRRVL